MKANPYPGRFIAFEGIDGSGKTVQVGFLKGFLKDNVGVDIVSTQEETDGQYGQQIREIVRNNGYTKSGKKLSDEEIQELYIKDRQEHRKWEVGELQKGTMVISDRDFLSGLAYGTATGIELERILQMHEEILGDLFFVPDIIFILDLEPQKAAERLKKVSRGQKGYFSDLIKQVKARKSFLELAKELSMKHPFLNIKIIDASQDQYQVFNEVKKALQ
jgi:dTMP kinase